MTANTLTHHTKLGDAEHASESEKNLDVKSYERSFFPGEPIGTTHRVYANIHACWLIVGTIVGHAGAFD